MSKEQQIGPGVARSSQPSTDPVQYNAATHRLPNLQKLYHVPAFALRELLQCRVPDRKFSHLRQAELIAEADDTLSITPLDVEHLYENYRYGQRLSFYLYLLPEGLVRSSIEDLQSYLDDMASLDRLASTAEAVPGQDYESNGAANHIVLMDEEQLNGIREIRFRYYVTHRFLNAEELPDFVLETWYGFLWLELDTGFLIILTRDEQVLPLLTQALASCLQAIPVPVRFDRELVDKHFSIEQIKRVSHYDPGTGVRQSISGRGLWQMFQNEILARERRYTRPSSLYDEDVGDGVVSGLGVTSSKGKIYLTRMLPTSVVRTWALNRLPDIVGDLKDLRSERPELFGRSVEAINRMRLSAAGRAAITMIVEALLEVERDELPSVSLCLSALEIYDALRGKYFTPYLRTQCAECEEIAELCPHCEGSDLEFKKGVVKCKQCRAVLSDKEAVVLRCMDGHVSNVVLDGAFNIAPNHWLQKRMVRILKGIGKSWSEQSDYFHIEGNTLYRLYQGQGQTEKLAPTVQNYINNFWDRVSGQIHVGQGDIVVEALPTEQQAEQALTAATPHTYKNFDLRLRGNAAAGYTIEAAVYDGSSVPPQPLNIPTDRAFEASLNSVLQQSTDSATLQSVGSALFRALFPVQIARLWTSAKARLGEQAGLRIRLHVDLPELMAFPWEMIFDEEYLGLHLRSPVVRYLDLPEPPRALAVEPPLRVLVALSQPMDMPSLDVKAELAGIRKALAALPDRIEMDILDSATRDALLTSLRQGYHVLHYLGHGAFENGKGYLILEDEQQRSDVVSARLLSQMVIDSTLRLAVLNACETSAVGLESPYGGLAHQLVRAGLPAVVAMQMPTPEQSAYAFSREFYGALADGWPVDAAVQAGRRSIMIALGNAWNSRGDWAIPTLYMRAPDGVILGALKEKPPRARARDGVVASTAHTTVIHGPVRGTVHSGSGDLHLR